MESGIVQIVYMDGSIANAVIAYLSEDTLRETYMYTDRPNIVMERELKQVTIDGRTYGRIKPKSISDYLQTDFVVEHSVLKFVRKHSDEISNVLKSKRRMS
jgi:hypothetical protein